MPLLKNADAPQDRLLPSAGEREPCKEVAVPAQHWVAGLVVIQCLWGVACSDLTESAAPDLAPPTDLALAADAAPDAAPAEEELPAELLWRPNQDLDVLLPPIPLGQSLVLELWADGSLETAAGNAIVFELQKGPPR